MTATATAPVCPKCAGPVWDQKGGKYWGNGLTKNGKQKPRWECRDRECAKSGGAIWEREGQTAQPPKAAAPVKQPISYQNVPDTSLPPLLRNQQEEDDAELASKVGFNISSIQKDLSLYQSIMEWYLDTIVPIVTRADVGCSLESVNSGVATIYIQVKRGQ